VTVGPANALGQAPPTPGPFSGLLAVDKAAGMTSHDVVVQVRRRLRTPGAGHLGTLDPGASGLLLIAMGAATRAIQVWQGGEKTYEATVRFGLVTSTQDVHGEVLERRDASPDEASVREASRAFVGEIDQVPPMVSALRVGGRRLHRLARRGIEVERQPRRIRVIEWEWLAIEGPEARFRIRCSGGTYVRTLAHDLGQTLGVGGALKTLRRLRSEPFGLERAVTVRDLAERTPEEVLAHGWSLDEALEVLPAVRLDADAVARIGVGGKPEVAPGAAPLSAGPRSVVLRDGEGRALALGELVPDPEAPARTIACPHVVFPWAVRQGRP
jgi:tRNA pseudouridine55 synthase